MNSIVIGGKGFLGNHLVHYLRNNGCQTRVYDIQEYEEPGYCQVNLADKDSVGSIDLNVDYIFMFAGLTGTYIGFDQYSKFNSVNELGLMNLLDAVRRSPFRPKIVFPSTRLVYRGADNALKESDEKECKTVYAVNKLACEGLLQAYSNSFDIPYTIFRICIPYGNLLSQDYSFGTVGFFIRQARAGKNITLYGGGTVKRTFTHMSDLCYQIVNGAFCPESDNEIYNVGGETLSLFEAAQIIANKYGVDIVSVPWPDRDLRIESGHTFFDDTKIRSLLQMPPYRLLADFSRDI